MLSYILFCFSVPYFIKRFKYLKNRMIVYYYFLEYHHYKYLLLKFQT